MSGDGERPRKSYPAARPAPSWWRLPRLPQSWPRPWPESLPRSPTAPALRKGRSERSAHYSRIRPYSGRRRR